MNDQDELSDQSEGESFSYSAPSGEPLSREPSEPLFDADFQVKQVLKCWFCHVVILQFPVFLLTAHLLLQIPPPAAQEPPVSDTADLLGLNTDTQTSSTASSSAAHQGVQGGMKAATSNSNLLNDLFAPPAGEAAPVQEDLLFTEPTSEAAATSKCMRNL